MRLFLVACAIVFTSIYGEDMRILVGEVKGDFELLGSLCFEQTMDEQDKVTTLNITLNAKTGGTLMFFDDQASSFIAVDSAPEVNSKMLTCEDKVNLAKTGRISYGPGETTTTYTITEHYKRQWYAVAANCGGKVELNSYEITSSGAIDCSDVHDERSLAPYTVSIVFLSVIAVVLVGVSAMLFQHGKRSPVVEDSSLTYNEL